MTPPRHDRYCSEILVQTELLRFCIEGADLTVAVASSPGWNVGQLLRPLGGAQRWAEATVRTPATQPIPDGDFSVRRFAHETVIHRAEATLAVGVGFR